MLVAAAACIVMGLSPSLFPESGVGKERYYIKGASGGFGGWQQHGNVSEREFQRSEFRNRIVLVKDQIKGVHMAMGMEG